MLVLIFPTCNDVKACANKTLQIVPNTQIVNIALKKI